MRLASTWLVIIGLTGPAAVAAQDTMDLGGPRAERLRQIIEDRFAERLQLELGLNADQAARVRGVLTTWAAKRRTLEREERQNRQQLAASMRPGIAANEQTVTRLVDNLLAGRVAYVQTFRDEVAELGTVLTPVQRAQYVVLRDRLIQRVQEIRNERGEGPQARRRPQ